MDRQEYLNQISASNRPEEKSRNNNILSSKYFLVGAIGVVALVLIMIIGAILGGGKGGEKNYSYALLLHINNTDGLIKEYQPNVKSSELRASSSSLDSVLTTTSADLTSYLTEKYNYKEKDVSKNIVEEATLQRDGLSNELFEAKINGILDRVYAHKMAYEISMFMTEENRIMNTTKNEVLTDILTTSYNSLENLYDKFNDFSEGK